MKIIYPEETLDLLATYDVMMNLIKEEHQRCYPLEDWQRKLLEHPLYQACLNAQAKIISLSSCTYQLDANER